MERGYYLKSTAINDKKNSYIENLKRSVRKIDAKIAIPLSGGSDSRAILATVLNEKKIMKLFTYGFAGNWDSDGAKIIAKSINSPIKHYKYSFRAHRNFWQTTDCQNVTKLQNTGVSIPFYQDTIYLKELASGNDFNIEIVNGNTGDFICGKHQPKTPFFLSLDDLTDFILAKYFHVWKDVSKTDKLILKKKIAVEINRINKKYKLSSYLESVYYFEWENRQAKYLISGQRAYDQMNLQWRLPFWSMRMCASHLPNAKLGGTGTDEYKSQLEKEYPSLFNDRGLKIKRYQGPFSVKICRFIFKKLFKYNSHLIKREKNIFQPFMSILKMCACQPYLTQALMIAPYNVETGVVIHHFINNLKNKIGN